ncbi:MAG: hypothetical protein OJF51_004112 [Nitrospira sp.]|jgi:hypothetical protein|nr:MAG: hypothetical protein OJF51_004112 [Nitrospira sp.]
MAKKKTSVPTPDTKVLKGTSGKLSKLTFKDIRDLGEVLMNYKGTLPSGYTRRRKGSPFCVAVTKKP